MRSGSARGQARISFDDPGLEDGGELFLEPVDLDEELVVREPEEVEDGGVPVGDADFALDGGRADVVGRSVGRAALDSLAPAIQPQKAFLLWSRPALVASRSGGNWAHRRRPNSPPQSTRVLSSNPRRFKSWSRPAVGRSVRSQAAFRPEARPVWLSQIWALI